MKRPIIFSILVAVVALVAAPGLADAPTPASGSWDYELTGPLVVRTAGPNVFIYGEDLGVWKGTFDGYTEEEFVVACHPKKGFNFYKGEMTFYGTVTDGSGVEHEGTMVLKTNAKQPAETCDPSPALWEGHWVIIGGTEGLADVHGVGTFTGQSFRAMYTGQIHFD